jgi:hypothetical protein
LIVPALAYLPYLAAGRGVIGFLPQYFDETSNMSVAFLITQVVTWAGGRPEAVVNTILVFVLAVISLVFMLKPARDGEEAIRRCLWPIGAFALLTQNLQPWYMLWLVPLCALFLRSGSLGLARDAWTVWFVYSSLQVLSYSRYIAMKTVEWTVAVQVLPLFGLPILLTIDQIHRIRAGRRSEHTIGIP